MSKMKKLPYYWWSLWNAKEFKLILTHTVRVPSKITKRKEAEQWAKDLLETTNCTAVSARLVHHDKEGMMATAWEKDIEWERSESSQDDSKQEV